MIRSLSWSRLAALAIFICGFASVAKAEENETFRTMYQAKKAIHEALAAGAEKKEPYALELARLYYRAADVERGAEESDPETYASFAKEALHFAKAAKKKAKTGAYITYERKYAVQPGTPASVAKYREELARHELDFFQFNVQYRKYDDYEKAAACKLAMEEANEEIREFREPLNIEAALKNVKGCVADLRNYRVPTIEFDTGKATLRNAEDPILKRSLMTLQETPWTEVSIEGHTDNEGTDAQNLGLSQRRSATIKGWLEKNGVVASRLKTKGFGERKPVASNETDAGKQTNRRTEFINTGKLYETKK